MKKTILSTMCLLIVLALSGGESHSAVTDITWNGDGSDSSASNQNNWSPVRVPTDRDRVIFDNTSVNDCDWNITRTFTSITVTSGYTGKITLPSTQTLTVSKNYNWTGGGGNNKASNADNWLFDVTPINGSNIVIDNSADNIVWDADMTMSPDDYTLGAGYTGIVNLQTGITTSGNFTIESGTLRSNNEALNIDGYIWIQSGGTLYGTGSPISLKGDWANSGNFIRGTSTVKFNGYDQIISGSTTFYDLELNPTSIVKLADTTRTARDLTVKTGTFDLNNKILDVDGTFKIEASATVDGTSSDIHVAGDWNNLVNFLPGTSTVILDGINQTVWGENTFYNLEKVLTTASADTLYFEAGKIQTILNNFTMRGYDTNHLLSLLSTSSGVQWYIDPQGTRNVSYVIINDLYNLNFADIVTTNSYGQSDNIYGVSFGGSECVN